MVWIFKPKQIGYFSHTEPFHQESLGLVDNEGMDIADGCAAGSMVNHIAEIAGRISQFAGTPGNCREALFVLKSLGEIIHQQAVEAFEDVAFAAFFFGKLAQVNALAVVQNQLKVTGKDSPEGRRVLVLLHFLSHGP